MREVQSGELEGKRGVLSPTILVIFGGTGDLSGRKLIPALFHLFCEGYLPASFRVVGMARKDLGDEGYRAFARNVLLERSNGREVELERFLAHLTYESGNFTEGESYRKLSERLISVEDEMGQCANKLFYLAVPPTSYRTIFKELADSGLTIPCSEETGWTRVLVEKPFGNDNETAAELDRTLGLLFKEEQIFRIDHYLAKEALQDVLLFRFSNSIFEPVWNNGHIERVEIKLFETLGMEGRGAFYDTTGALRDVGQNHLLQMLALVAMENPGALDAVLVRDKRAEVIRALLPVTKEIAERDIVRGQYEGYREEPGVNPASTTETYFRAKVEIENDRWRGVPFVLESGKALGETKTEITVYFKPPEHCLCGPHDYTHANALTFRIQPNEGISILFWAKRRGFGAELEAKKLSFAYRDLPAPSEARQAGEDENGGRIPDAYERVLYDAIMGDQILFTSTDEVMAAWVFITPIIEAWKDTPLHPYERGSMGPRMSI